MEYHIQTKINGTNKKGNCFQTAIACLLSMDPEDVPNIEVFLDVPDLNWTIPFNQWLAHKGYLLRMANEFKCYHLTDEIDEALFEDRHGISAKQMRWELRNQLYLMSGQSPRNPSINHVLIYREGKYVHDTFPGPHQPLYCPEGAKPHTQFTFEVLEKL